jgi:hypothetical protein
MNSKHIAAAFNGMTPFKGFDYRELLSEFNIKKAVAFFRIFFSSSMRAIRFLSARISS